MAFGNLVNARYHNMDYLLRWQLLLAKQRLRALASAAYLQCHRFLSEMCNFLGRMKTPHDEFACLLEVGPAFAETEADNLFLDKCIDARIQGIQSMQAKRTYATTLIDAQIFLEGWQKGQEWAFGNIDNGASYNAICGRG